MADEDLIDNLAQGWVTPGTPEGFAWHAKRFHAQANFKLLRFNKFTFESVSDFQCCGLKSHSIKVFLGKWEIYLRENLFFDLH